MLFFGICDDFQDDRNLVKKWITDYCERKDYQYNIVHFNNGEALVNYYIDEKMAFDIVFLDIYIS